MSALTEIFNYLFAYLFVCTSLLFSDLNTDASFLSPEVQEIVFSIGQNLNAETFATLRPILFISTGIFVCGAIIGFVKRLIK